MKPNMLCKICPRKCGVNREVEKGFCRSGENPIVNLAMPHYGEEPCISGSRGSGTIFFSNCNLACVYCQNHTISQEGRGKVISIEELAQMMLELQDKHVHNVNLVTPTHFTLQIRDAILFAREQGLRIPIVWNSNAYELPETLELMDGLIDIYMPDLRYTSADAAGRFSRASDYPQYARKAILEMYRQVGHLAVDDDDIARKGLLIRLLVLPEDIGGIGDGLRWIADALGSQTHISLMSQYYPVYRANEFPPLDRSLLQDEYEKVLEILSETGLGNGYVQELRPSREWTPSFR